MKIFLTTILLVINLFSQDINTNLELTLKEKEFIEKTHFNIAITKNWYPFSFEEDNNKALGISSEFWEIIVKKLNLKTSNTFFNSFDEQIKSFQSGKSDIIFSAGESESRKKFAYFSNEYLKFPISIVTKKDEHFIENIDDIINKKIAVGNNFTAHNLLKQKYPNFFRDSLSPTLKIISLFPLCKLFICSSKDLKKIFVVFRFSLFTIISQNSDDIPSALSLSSSKLIGYQFFVIATLK